MPRKLSLFRRVLANLAPVPLLLAGCCSTALLPAAIIPLSTGVASWNASGPNVAGTNPAVNLGATPNAVWLPAPGGSQWVSTVATDGSLSTTTGIPGTYLFTLTIATPGLGGSLNYLVAADNQGTVRVLLDGVPISTFSHPGNTLTDAGSAAQGCAFLPPGSSLCLPAGTSQGMVGPGAILIAAGGAGVLTIEATVINSEPPNPSPIGFLLSGNADVNTVVPEPSAYAMAAIGLGMIVAGRKRLRS